ncbi:MAG: ABC transporter permease [Candidatus Limnocylindria bacterium]
MTTAARAFRRPRIVAWMAEFRSAVWTIMVKELRSRMRGRRAFVVLTVYLLVLAAITYAVYQATYQAVSAFAAFGGTAVNASASIGQAIFTTLSLLQLLLIAFIAPAFTAGAISLEREKQTLDLLVTTPLRPGAIVVGKLLAALAFALLLIVAGIPLSAIVLMYGGAAVDDLVRQLFVLIAAAVGFGSIGLFFSALTKRTQAATVLTYSAMLVLTLGTTFSYLIWSVMSVAASSDLGAGGIQRRPPEAILYLNPFVAMADVIANTEQPNSGGFFTSALAAVRGIDLFGITGGGVVGGGEVVCQGNTCFERPLGPNVLPADIGGLPAANPPGVTGHFWPRFALAVGTLALVLTVVSTRLVAPTGRWLRTRRRPARARSEAVA